MTRDLTSCTRTSPLIAVAGVEAVRAGPLHVQVAGGDDRRVDGFEGATVEGVRLGQAHRHAVDEHLASPHRHDITGDARHSLEQRLVAQPGIGLQAGLAPRTL
jgi:hypothetical protein